MAPCTHPGTSREVNAARRPHTCSRPCAFEEKKNRKTKIKKKFAPPKTQHEIHSSTATATTSRRHAKNHVPRVSPYSPVSVDTGFVEIGLVQLSRSVKMAIVTHTLTDTHIPTDKLKNGTLYAPRYEETFLPKGKKRPRLLRSLGLASLWRVFFALKAKNRLGRLAPSALPHY